MEVVVLHVFNIVSIMGIGSNAIAVVSWTCDRRTDIFVTRLWSDAGSFAPVGL